MDLEREREKESYVIGRERGKERDKERNRQTVFSL